MFLIITGLFILLVGIAVGKADSAAAKFGNLLKLGGVATMLFGTIISCVVQIEPGQIGIQKLFGKIDEKNVLTNGLNFVNPLVEVIRLDIKTQNYTMASIHDEGDRTRSDAVAVLSADGLEVHMDISILYRISPTDAPRIIKETGTDYIEKIVRPVTRTRIRDIAVYYDAVSLYSKKRDEFQAKIFNGIMEDFKKRGIVLEQVLIRNINLPQSVKAAIEAKINAEQEAQKMEFVLQKERQEAERKRVEAQGIADYQRIVSSGLTEKQLQYEMIKAIKESPNSKIIVMGNGKGMPLILGGN
ncbi:MAG: prohibitin family protein [Cytophagaceae bacterium]|nr:prohibitin family protein [Cytophagaceae bacterium]MDW8455369.1 prohibitin family protein [Cytophagaceae bacterium]